MTTQLAQVLRLLSTLACGVILIAFGFWAADEGRASSEQQVARVASSTSVPQPPPLQAPAEHHGGVRGTIEDASAKLTAPFEGVTDTRGPWVRHGIPVLLALLTYGLLARLLINYIPQRT
jgi:hypothetical protein